MSIFASILTGGSNNHQTTAEEVNALATDFVSEGVVGAITNTGGVAPATGGFAVNAQGSPAMAVDVSAGIAYVTATPTGGSSQTLRVKSTATEEVTIAANSTGSTRYDWIYIKIDPDKAANPAADGSDVATLVTSRSTSSSSDDGTPPTYGYPIAVVTVANGASSITNANITDLRELATSVQDGSVTAAKLLSTIFSGQVQTGSNSGSAGGSYSYINLGGIKLLWGKTAHMNTAEPRTVSLPASFFSSVTAAIVAAGELTSDGRQIAYISSAPTTSSLIIQLILAAGGAGNGKVSYLVIGT